MASTEGDEERGDEDGGDGFPRQQVMKYVEDWFEAKPSIYPPNRNDMVEWKMEKVIRRDHNQVVHITRTDYMKYKAVDAKYSIILFEFVPGSKRMKGFGENGASFLKTKRLNSPSWSFGSCHACWKEVRRNFTDTTRTKHPYRTTFDNPNLSVLDGCGCVICNVWVMEMEKYSEKEERCTGCSYCGYPTSCNV